METNDEARQIARFQLLAQIASGLVILVGLLVLFGRAAGYRGLKTVLPGLKSHEPRGHGRGVLAASVALWLLVRPGSVARRRLAQALAVCVVLVSVLRLAGYATGWDNGPDRWLFGTSSNNMSLLTGCAQYGSLFPVMWGNGAGPDST